MESQITREIAKLKNTKITDLLYHFELKIPKDDILLLEQFFTEEYDYKLDDMEEDFFFELRSPENDEESIAIAKDQIFAPKIEVTALLKTLFDKKVKKQFKFEVKEVSTKEQKKHDCIFIVGDERLTISLEVNSKLAAKRAAAIEIIRLTFRSVFNMILLSRYLLYPQEFAAFKAKKTNKEYRVGGRKNIYVELFNVETEFEEAFVTTGGINTQTPKIPGNAEKIFQDYVEKNDFTSIVNSLLQKYLKSHGIKVDCQQLREMSDNKTHFRVKVSSSKPQVEFAHFLLVAEKNCQHSILKNAASLMFLQYFAPMVFEKVWGLKMKGEPLPQYDVDVSMSGLNSTQNMLSDGQIIQHGHSKQVTSSANHPESEFDAISLFPSVKPHHFRTNLAAEILYGEPEGPVRDPASRKVVPPPGLQVNFEENEDPGTSGRKDRFDGFADKNQLFQLMDESYDNEFDDSIPVSASYLKDDVPKDSQNQYAMPRQIFASNLQPSVDHSESGEFRRDECASSILLDWVKTAFNIKWEVSQGNLQRSGTELELKWVKKPPVLGADDFMPIIEQILKWNKLRTEFLLIGQQFEQFWTYRITLKTLHPHSGKEELVGFRDVEVSAEDLDEEIKSKEKVAFLVGLTGVFPDLDNLIAFHQIRILIGLDKGYKPMLYNISDSSLSGKKDDSSTENSQRKASQKALATQQPGSQKSPNNSQTATSDSANWQSIPDKTISGFFMGRTHLLSEGQIKEVYFNAATVAKYKLSTENYYVKLGKKLDQFLNLARTAIQAKDFASLFNHFAMIYNAQPTINETDPSAAQVLIADIPILKVVNECKNKKVRKNLVFLTAVRFLWEDFFRDELK